MTKEERDLLLAAAKMLMDIYQRSDPKTQSALSSTAATLDLAQRAVFKQIHGLP